MQDERYAFRDKKHLILPILFLLPQLVITVVFFFYPAGEALLGSVYMEDSFGLSREFVGLDNFVVLFSDPGYLETLYLTFIFSIATITGSAIWCTVLAWFGDKVGARNPDILNSPETLIAAVKAESHLIVLGVLLLAGLYALMKYLTREKGNSTAPQSAAAPAAPEEPTLARGETGTGQQATSERKS